MKKKNVTKIMSYLLTAAMLAGGVSLSPLTMVEAQAAAGEKKVNLNVSGSIAGIDNPDATAQSVWTGTTVYYGNKPYYVLDKDGTAKDKANSGQAHSSKSGHMLLLSKGVLEAGGRHFDNSACSDWTNSSIRTALNGNDFLTKEGNFTDTEKDAISETIISQANTDKDYSFSYPSDTTTDKIFLLDLNDVRNSNYGFSDNNNTRKANPNCMEVYWLRSPGEYNSWAALVTNEGVVNSSGTAAGANGSARPAYNVKLSTVLFSSADSYAKGDFAKVEENQASANTWKLTLHDDNNGFAANRTDAGDLSAGTTVHINVSNIREAGKGEAYNAISAILTDSNDTVLCYGKANTGTGAAEGNYTFVIPEVSGGAHLYVFAEKVSQTAGTIYTTDYASNMVEPAYTNTITVNPERKDFVSANYGYTTRPEAQTFTITNTGDINITGFEVSSAEDYDVTYASGSIAKGDSASFTVQPKLGLPVGEHHAALSVTTTPALSSEVTVPVSFTVAQEQAAAPEFTPDGGTYSSAQNVALSSATEGATIYYTTNGDTPTTSSTQYQSDTPIVVSESQTIKAIAAKSGMADSEIASASYVIEIPVPGSHTITTRVSPLNGGSVTGGGSVSDGGSTTLSATANKGYKFVKWLKGDSVVSTSASYEVTNVTEDAEYIAVFKKKAAPQNDDEDDEEESRPSDNHGRTQQPPQDILQFTYSADPANARVFKAKQGPLCELAFRMATPAGYQEAFSFNLFLTGKAMYEPKQKTLTLTIPEMYRKSGRKFAIIGVDQNGAARVFTDSDFIDSTITIQMDGFEGFAFSVIYTDVK